MSAKEIHEHIKPYFLRRKKTEVLKELPPIISQSISVKLEKDQIRTYNQIWNNRYQIIENKKSNTNMLALITKLKKICNYEPNSEDSSKFDALKLILENIYEKEDKILIFSQFVETLKWLSKRITLNHELFHGGLSSDEKNNVIANFKNKPGPRAILISLKAGGVGLNLQEASTVVLFDRWWNPAVEKQAEARAHRYGRKTPLHVIKFITLNTVEERILSILNEKEEIFEEYIEKAESAKIALDANVLKKILEIN